MQLSSRLKLLLIIIAITILVYFVLTFLKHSGTYSWNLSNFRPNADLIPQKNTENLKIEQYIEPINVLARRSEIRAMPNEKAEMERLKFFLANPHYQCTESVEMGSSPKWSLCVDSNGGIKLKKARVFSIRHSLQDYLSTYSLENELVEKYSADVKILHSPNVTENFEIPWIDSYTIYSHAINKTGSQKKTFSLLEFSQLKIDLLNIEILGYQQRVYDNLLYLQLLSNIKQLHLQIRLESLPLEGELLYFWYKHLFDTFTKGHLRMYSSQLMEGPKGSCNVNILKDCFIITSWAAVHNPLIQVVTPPAGLGTVKEEMIRYINYIINPHILCPKKQLRGGKPYKPSKTPSFIDGSWNVCYNTKYGLGHKPCLVYSFGISNDWSFDESMEKEGCQVFSFDPSIGLENHKHSQNISFFKFGLGSKDEIWKKDGVNWNMKTLASIVKHLGHENQIIDFLKFDIESSEWKVFPNLFQDGILRNINQLAFELHNPCSQTASQIKTSYTLMFTLELLGFSIFDVHQNPISAKMHSLEDADLLKCAGNGYFLYELAWLKTRDVFSQE